MDGLDYFPYVPSQEERHATSYIRSALRIDVTAFEPGADLNRLLDEAVFRLIPTAIAYGRGILVTQLSYYKYSVVVDASVPCGLIEEKRLSE